MRKEHILKTSIIAALTIFFLMNLSCGGAKGRGANEPLRTGKAKYDNYFEKADRVEKQIKEAKENLQKAQADLAVAVGLDAKATLPQIKDAIKTLIENSVVKAGGHVEVTIEGGIFGSGGASLGSEGLSAGAEGSAEIKVVIKVVGDVQVSAEVEKLTQAAQIALAASAKAATDLKGIGAEVPDLITEGADLSASVATDFDPITAAKVTARLTGLTSIFKEASALFDASFNFTIEIKASFTMEASAEASA